jgi:flagellar protein FlgJ
MRRTVPRGGLLPKTTGYDSWDMVMDQHVAEELSKRNGGLGLQKIIYDQVIQTMKPKGSTK